LDQAGDQFSLAWAPRSSGGAAFWAAQALVSTHFVGSAVGGFRYPFKLASGQTIAGGPLVQRNANFFATLAYNNGYAHSHWLGPAATTGFIGFEFNGGSGTQLAWVRIQLDTGANQNDFTLVDYAWGDPGDVFNAGDLVAGAAVPEPATFAVGLLATGAIGVTALRKRRAAKAAVNS
jgi:hypothetical protein